MATVAQRDYYEILGVTRDTAPEAIRKAYLKLAHKYHPDKTGGDKAAEEKLKEINEAYDTLKNPEKRKQYDAMSNAPWGSSENFSSGFNGFDFENAGGDSAFEDILGSLFGGKRATGHQAAAAWPGNDVETHVAISLQEAADGSARKIRVPRRETCPGCHGTGAVSGNTQPCPACKGTGQARQTHGALHISKTCGQCRGSGTYIKDPCTSCSGQGWIQRERELSVNIPPGIESGARLRLAGEGEPGFNSGPRGDLYVQVILDPDPFLMRDKDDLTCEIPIPFHLAALGGTVRVPTLKGVAELNIPAGAQQGALLRMRGLGMPHRHGAGRGDQVVRITIEVPTRLTKRQREVLHELAGPEYEDAYPRYRRFTDSLKNRRKG